MTVIFQDPLRPHAVLRAITELVDNHVTALRIAVAYVTTAGVKALIGDIATAAGGPTWRAAEKTLITTFDYGRTEPDALRLLLRHGFEVRVAILGLHTSERRSDATSWHPKTYIVCTPKKRRAFVGSANLSRRALTVNTEMGVVVKAPVSGELDTAWEQLFATSELLDEPSLRAYERTRAPQVPEPVEAAAPDGAPHLDDLRLFSDAVLDGEVRPADFSALWLDAGSMSSSSSHSQLELPRYASRFFGFDFRRYNRNQQTIGEIGLVVDNSSPWTRSLAWHGDNGMERINLPTPRMLAEAGVGSLEWANTVVLFQRAASGVFIVTAAHPDSGAARAWQRESVATEQIFRLGQNSSRLCGLI
ncbi:phospholipase D-like domain-containing protein [Micromonospora sp. WMMD558]|uniref:phospholipase D-like domain-containing protein n=1 Tax=Micromonospora sp. WMMD558 TaxID=3403462 RepID=UPI003BF4D82D